jgi:hypothetical protein
MEAASEEGKENISGTTYNVANNLYTYTFPGKTEANNKGPVHMYYVDKLID